MIETTPRDKLGRIIYRKDIFDEQHMVLQVHDNSVDKLYSILGVDTFTDSLSTYNNENNITIDLERSPYATNYERYFADLGTRKEINDAVDDICSDMIYDKKMCMNCVFYKWQSVCDVQLRDCSSFINWLDQEATV